jgi:hypothetical protein
VKGKTMAKHVWFKDDRGQRDDFRLDFGFHNGPQCEACLETYCEHCVDVETLDDCEAIIVVHEAVGR